MGQPLFYSGKPYKYMIRLIVVFVTLRDEAFRVFLGSGSFPTVRMTSDREYFRLLNGGDTLYLLPCCSKMND